MNKKLFFYLFLLVSLADVVSIITMNYQLRYVVKPLILTSLLLLYFVSAVKVNRQYVIALILCLLGDVFLLFSGKQNFILGLASFLLGHVFYIIILAKKSEKILPRLFLQALIPFAIVFITLISVLFKSLDGMLLPVIIYGTIICTMGTFALYHYLKIKNNSSLLFLIGSSFFILSDSILAINKFLMPKHILAILVMITYILAQYLICKAMLTDK